MYTLARTAVIVLLTGSICWPAMAAEEEADSKEVIEVETNWLDDFYMRFSQRVVNTADWFDTLYLDGTEQSIGEADGSARLRLAWEPRSGDFSEFKVRFRARFKLPNLQERVDLIFSDTDENQIQQPFEAARNDDTNVKDELNLALRWQFVDTGQSKWFSRLGLGRRAQIYGKTGYQHLFNVTEKAVFRFEPSLYWYSRDGFGFRTQGNLDIGVSDHSLLRFANNFYYSVDDEQWEWQHSGSYFYQVSDKRAYIAGIYVDGVSEPNYRAEQYSVSFRVRQNTLRPWLFFEIEPFVLWRRDEGFDASPGIALRVEGFFNQ